MDELNLYDDLDEFQEQQDKKSKELKGVEEKYEQSLKIISNLEIENKTLTKKIQRIELSFQSLLDTARAELKRKDKEIERLRKEKDDICFRRRIPPRQRETETQQFTEKSAQQREFVKNPFRSDTTPETVTVDSTFDFTQKHHANIKETSEIPLKGFIEPLKRNRLHDDDHQDRSKKHKHNDFDEVQKTKSYKTESDRDTRNKDRLIDSERCQKESTSRRDLSRNHLTRNHSPNRKNRDKEYSKASDSSERNRNHFDRARSGDGNRRPNDRGRENKKSSKSSESPERNSKHVERGRSRYCESSNNHHKERTKHKSHDRKNNDKNTIKSSKSPERKRSKDRSHHNDYHLNKNFEKSHHLGFKDATKLSEKDKTNENPSRIIDELQSSYEIKEVVLTKITKSKEDNNNKSNNKEKEPEKPIEEKHDNDKKSLLECKVLSKSSQEVTKHKPTATRKDSLSDKFQKVTSSSPTLIIQSLDLPISDEKLLKCKDSSKNQKPIEQNSIATQKLSTPRKMALFDSLFGPSPSSNSSSTSPTTSCNSSKSLLTNIMGILASSTTPSPEVNINDNSRVQTPPKNEEKPYDAQEFDKCFTKNADGAKNEMNIITSIDLTDDHDNIDVNDIEFVQIPGLDFHTQNYTTIENNKNISVNGNLDYLTINNITSNKNSAKLTENKCEEVISIKEILPQTKDLNKLTAIVIDEKQLNHQDYFTIPGLDLLTTSNENSSIVSEVSVPTQSVDFKESNHLLTSSEPKKIESDVLEGQKEKSNIIPTTKDEESITGTTLVLESNEVENISKANTIVSDINNEAISYLSSTKDILNVSDNESEILQKNIQTIENTDEILTKTEEKILETLSLDESESDNGRTNQIAVSGEISKSNQNNESLESISVAETIEDIQVSLSNCISTEKLEDVIDQNLETHTTEKTADDITKPVSQAINKTEDLQVSLSDSLLKEKLIIQDVRRHQNLETPTTEKSAGDIIGPVSLTQVSLLDSLTSISKPKDVQEQNQESQAMEKTVKSQIPENRTNTANKNIEVLQVSVSDSLVREKLTILDVRDPNQEIAVTEKSDDDITGPASPTQVSLLDSLTSIAKSKHDEEQNQESHSQIPENHTKTANKNIEDLQVSVSDSLLSEITQVVRKDENLEISITEKLAGDITGPSSHTKVSLFDSLTSIAKPKDVEEQNQESHSQIPENHTKTANKNIEDLQVSVSDSLLREITQDVRRDENLEISIKEKLAGDITGPSSHTKNSLLDSLKSIEKPKDLEEHNQESHSQIPENHTKTANKNIEDLQVSVSDSLLREITQDVRREENLEISIAEELASDITGPASPTQVSSSLDSVTSISKPKDVEKQNLESYATEKTAESQGETKTENHVLDENAETSTRNDNEIAEKIHDNETKIANDNNILSENHSPEDIQIGNKDKKSTSIETEHPLILVNDLDLLSSATDKPSRNVESEQIIVVNHDIGPMKSSSTLEKSTSNDFSEKISSTEAENICTESHNQSDNSKSQLEDNLKSLATPIQESSKQTTLTEKEFIKETDIRDEVAMTNSVNYENLNEKQVKNSKVLTPTQETTAVIDKIVEIHIKEAISLDSDLKPKESVLPKDISLTILNNATETQIDLIEAVSMPSSEFNSTQELIFNTKGKEELVITETSDEIEPKYSKSLDYDSTSNLRDKDLTNENEILDTNFDTSEKIHYDSPVNSELIPFTQTSSIDIENEENIVIFYKTDVNAVKNCKRFESSSISELSEEKETQILGEDVMSKTNDLESLTSSSNFESGSNLTLNEQIKDIHILDEDNMSINNDLEHPTQSLIMHSKKPVDLKASPQLESVKVKENDQHILETYTIGEIPAKILTNEDIEEENCITNNLEVSKKPTNMKSKDEFDHPQEDVVSTSSLKTISTEEENEYSLEAHDLNEANNDNSKSCLGLTHDIANVSDTEELEKSLLEYVKLNKPSAKIRMSSEDTLNPEISEKHTEQEEVFDTSNDHGNSSKPEIVSCQFNLNLVSVLPQKASTDSTTDKEMVYSAEVLPTATNNVIQSKSQGNSSLALERIGSSREILDLGLVTNDTSIEPKTTADSAKLKSASSEISNIITEDVLLPKETSTEECEKFVLPDVHQPQIESIDREPHTIPGTIDNDFSIENKISNEDLTTNNHPKEQTIYQETKQTSSKVSENILSKQNIENVLNALHSSGIEVTSTEPKSKKETRNPVPKAVSAKLKSESSEISITITEDVLLPKETLTEEREKIVLPVNKVEILRDVEQTPNNIPSLPLVTIGSSNEILDLGLELVSEDASVESKTIKETRKPVPTVDSAKLMSTSSEISTTITEDVLLPKDTSTEESEKIVVPDVMRPPIETIHRQPHTISGTTDNGSSTGNKISNINNQPKEQTTYQETKQTSLKVSEIIFCKQNIENIENVLNALHSSGNEVTSTVHKSKKEIRDPVPIADSAKLKSALSEISITITEEVLLPKETSTEACEKIVLPVNKDEILRDVEQTPNHIPSHPLVTIGSSNEILDLDLTLVTKDTSTEPKTIKETRDPVPTENSAKLMSLEISTTITEDVVLPKETSTEESEEIVLPDVMRPPIEFIDQEQHTTTDTMESPKAENAESNNYSSIENKISKEDLTTNNQPNEQDSNQTSSKVSENILSKENIENVLNALHSSGNENEDHINSCKTINKDEQTPNNIPTPIDIENGNSDPVLLNSSEITEGMTQIVEKETTISELDSIAEVNAIDKSDKIESTNALLSLNVSINSENLQNVEVIQKANNPEKAALNQVKTADIQLPTSSNTTKILPKEIKIKEKTEELLNSEHKFFTDIETIPQQKESYIKSTAMQYSYNIPSVLPSISTNSPTPSNFSGIFSKKSLQLAGEDDFVNQKHKRRLSHMNTTKPREYVLLAASVLCNVDNLENATKANKKLHWELLENKNELTEIEDDTDVDNTDEERNKVKEEEEEENEEELPLRLTPYKCMESLISDSESEDESRYGSLPYLNSAINKQKPLNERRRTIDTVPINLAVSYYKRLEELEQKKNYENMIQMTKVPDNVKKNKRCKPKILKNVKPKRKAVGGIKVIDVETLIDHSVVQEISKNNEINKSHTEETTQVVREIKKRGRPKKKTTNCTEIQRGDLQKLNEIVDGINDDVQNVQKSQQKNDDTNIEINSEYLLHSESHKQSKIKESQINEISQQHNEAKQRDQQSMNTELNKSFGDHKIYQEFLPKHISDKEKVFDEGVQNGIDVVHRAVTGSKTSNMEFTENTNLSPKIISDKPELNMATKDHAKQIKSSEISNDDRVMEKSIIYDKEDSIDDNNTSVAENSEPECNKYLQDDGISATSEDTKSPEKTEILNVKDQKISAVENQDLQKLKVRRESVKDPIIYETDIQNPNEDTSKATQNDTQTKKSIIIMKSKTQVTKTHMENVNTTAAVANSKKKIVSLEDIGIKVRPFKGHLSSFRIPKVNKDLKEGPKDKAWKLETYREVSNETYHNTPNRTNSIGKHCDKDNYISFKEKEDKSPYQYGEQNLALKQKKEEIKLSHQNKITDNKTQVLCFEDKKDDEKRTDRRTKETTTSCESKIKETNQHVRYIEDRHQHSLDKNQHAISPQKYSNLPHCSKDQNLSNRITKESKDRNLYTSNTTKDFKISIKETKNQEYKEKAVTSKDPSKSITHKRKLFSRELYILNEKFDNINNPVGQECCSDRNSKNSDINHEQKVNTKLQEIVREFSNRNSHCSHSKDNHPKSDNSRSKDNHTKSDISHSKDNNPKSDIKDNICHVNQKTPLLKSRRKSTNLHRRILDSSSDEETPHSSQVKSQDSKTLKSLKSQRKSVNLHRRILVSSCDEDNEEIIKEKKSSNKIKEKETNCSTDSNHIPRDDINKKDNKSSIPIKSLRMLKKANKEEDELNKSKHLESQQIVHLIENVNFNQNETDVKSLRIHRKSISEEKVGSNIHQVEEIENLQTQISVDKNQPHVINCNEDQENTKLSQKPLKMRRKSMYQESHASGIEELENPKVEEIENNLNLQIQISVDKNQPHVNNCTKDQENTKLSQKPLKIRRKSMYQESHASVIEELEKPKDSGLNIEDQIGLKNLQPEVTNNEKKDPNFVPPLKPHRKSIYQERVSSNSTQELKDIDNNQHLVTQNSIDKNQLKSINNEQKCTNQTPKTKSTLKRRKSLYQENLPIDSEEEETKRDNQEFESQRSEELRNKEKEDSPSKTSIKRRRISMYQENDTFNNHKEATMFQKEEHEESKIISDKNHMEIRNKNKEKEVTKTPAVSDEKKKEHYHQKTDFETESISFRQNTDTQFKTDSNIDTVPKHNEEFSTLDSSSQDSQSLNQTQSRIQELTPLTATKPKTRKRRVVTVLSTSREESPSTYMKNLQIQHTTTQCALTPPLISPTYNHPIFNTEDSQQQNDFAPILPPTPNKQYDEKFREIDSKLHEIFQSPQYMVDYKTTLDAATTASTPLTLDVSNPNLTIEETMVSNQENDQSSMNKTNHNDSMNINDTLAHNQSGEVKHLNLGSSEYRFEKVSDNVVNLFISRKRKRKRTN